MPNTKLANHCVRNVASSKLKVTQRDMALIRLPTPCWGVHTPLLPSGGAEEVRTVRPPHSAPVGSSAHPGTRSTIAFRRDTAQREGKRSQAEWLHLFLTCVHKTLMLPLPQLYQLA